jgi:hypothetical protein
VSCAWLVVAILLGPVPLWWRWYGPPPRWDDPWPVAGG